METPAETAARFGVRPEQLPDLLEVPKFAEALASAQADPSLPVATLIVAHSLPAKKGVPMEDPSVLDVDALHAQAISQRLRRERLEDVGRRSDGSTRSPERMAGTALSIGRMEKAEKLANNRLKVIEHLNSLLTDTTNNGLPAVTNVNAARKLVKDALR